MVRKVLLAASAVGLLAATSVPASAQVGDFFCSTFSVFCPDPPPPPPPPPPMAEPAPAPVKHRMKKKAKPKKEAPAATAPQ